MSDYNYYGHDADEAICMLRDEAIRAGDGAQADLCTLALAGDVEARAKCAEAIAEAAAMDDGEEEDDED